MQCFGLVSRLRDRSVLPFEPLNRIVEILLKVRGEPSTRDPSRTIYFVALKVIGKIAKHGFGITVLGLHQQRIGSDFSHVRQEFISRVTFFERFRLCDGSIVIVQSFVIAERRIVQTLGCEWMTREIFRDLGVEFGCLIGKFGNVAGGIGSVEINVGSQRMIFGKRSPFSC